MKSWKTACAWGVGPESWDPDRPRTPEQYLENNARRRARRTRRLVHRLYTFSQRFMVGAFALTTWVWAMLLLVG